MTESLSELFNGKIRQVEEFEAECNSILEEVAGLLDETETEALKEVREAQAELAKATANFKKAMDTPVITLATTGTTSSGKSTLVNMLCGAEIMPVAVQEMSAGTVEIHHHATDCFLKIPPVPGLPDEYSGEWRGLSDESIKLYLTRLMDSYRELREKNEEPPAPTIELHYPTRLGQSEVFTNLFSDDYPIKLCIMDLPGFKHLSDVHNRKVIQEKIKPALCLVTYNSGETDPIRREKLLEEVVEQVKEMRGTPARMLFILNLFDVFLRDDNPEKSKTEFKKSITDNIISALEKALPEYSAVIRELQTHELSALPSLLACQAIQDKDNSGIHLKKIEKNFNAMIPESLLEDLPRNIEKWKDKDKKQVAEAVWEASYGKKFDQTLEQHIYNNLPEILLPHLLQPLGKVSSEAVDSINQISLAHINATEMLYKKECEKLDSIETELRILRDDNKEQIYNIFGNLSFFEDDTEPEKIYKEDFEQVSLDIEDEYELPPGTMAPFYDWLNNLESEVLCLNNALNDYIKTGVFNEYLDRLPVEKRKSLEMIYLDLKLYYLKKYGESGGSIDFSSKENIAKITDEKKLDEELKKHENFSNISRAVKDLCEYIINTTTYLLGLRMEKDSERLQISLNMFFNKYLDKIGCESKKIAPELNLDVTYGLTMNDLCSFSDKISFDPHIKIEEADDKIIYKTEKKRRLKSLYLFKIDTDVYVGTIKMNKAKIKSFEEILKEIRDKFTEGPIEKNYREFTLWVKEQTLQMLKDIDSFQENTLLRYRNHLERAREVAYKSKESDIDQWSKLLNKNMHAIKKQKYLQNVRSI